MILDFLNTRLPERLALAGGMALALSACAPEFSRSESDAIEVATRDCGRTQASGCYFADSPVSLEDKPIRLPGRPYTFFRTARSLTFVDAAGKSWNAPDATLTDGASIPLLFVPIVGNPRTPEFANAAAMHDAYCGIGNEQGPAYHGATWQEVHRMFYDTLVVGDTAVSTAQLMFAAVWLGGPRWHPVDGRKDTTLDRIPMPIRTRAMIQTKAFIKREKPDVPELMLYLGWQEGEMAWSADVIGSHKALTAARPPKDPAAGGSNGQTPRTGRAGGQGARPPGQP